MGAFSENDADEFRLCVADEFRSRAGVRLNNLRDIAVQRVDYFENGLTISVSAAVRVDQMGDGWRDNAEAAAAFARFLERQWQPELYDLKAQARIQVAVEVDEQPFSTTGLNPSVTVQGLDDVYRQIEWEEHVRSRLPDARYLFDVFCMYSAEAQKLRCSRIPAARDANFPEMGMSICVIGSVRGGDAMVDGWADVDAATDAFARFVEARWRDDLADLAQNHHVEVSVVVDEYGGSSPDVSISGYGFADILELAEHVSGRLTDLGYLWSRFCSEPAPELLAAA